MIIIIDFDGTIVENAWPEVGELRKNAVKVIKKIHEDGNTILIDTCRTGRYEAAAVDILVDNGIPFDYVNCNLPSQIELYKMDCRKLSGDMRIDDTNYGGIPDDWDEIYEGLLKHPKYPLKSPTEWAELKGITNPTGYSGSLITASEFYRRVAVSNMNCLEL